MVFLRTMREKGKGVGRVGGWGWAQAKEPASQCMHVSPTRPGVSRACLSAPNKDSPITLQSDRNPQQSAASSSCPRCVAELNAGTNGTETDKKRKRKENAEI